MADRRASYQYIPSQVLEDQRRTDTGAAWARAQRQALGQQWADLHLSDAYDRLSSLLFPQQQEPTAPAAPPPAPAAVGPDPLQTGAEGDRPASEFRSPVDKTLALLDTQPAAPSAPQMPGMTPAPFPDVSAPSQDFQPPLATPPEAGPPQQTAFNSLSQPGQLTAPPVPDPTSGPFAPEPDVRAATAIEQQIGGMGQDVQRMGDLSLANIRAAHRGESLPPDQAQQLSDLSSNYGLALTGEPIAKVGGEAAAAAAGEVARLRLDKFPADVRSTIEQAAQRGDYWLQQRRNVIPDAEAEKMADELGRTIESFVASRPGKAFNTEETRALRNALTGKAIEVDDLKSTVEALGDKASDALKRQLGQAQSDLLALSRVAEGARAEAGRTFRAYLADTRGRLARSRSPEYTNVSTVPITAAPELEGRVVQPTLEGPPSEHRLGQMEQLPTPEPLRQFGDPPVVQAEATGFDPITLGRQPVAPGEKAPPQPGSAIPRVTEQAALGIDLPPRATGPQPTLVATPLRDRILGRATQVYDNLALARVAGMLSAVPTHLVNATANVVQGAGTVAQKPLQAGVDIARVGVGRALGQDVERTRYMAEVAPQVEGYAKGMWAGLQQVPGILAGGSSEAQLAETGGRHLSTGIPALNTVGEMTTRLLTASDAIFRTAALGGHAAALAERQAIQEGLKGAMRDARAKEILGNISDYPGLLESANKLAARDVFQESRGLTDAISKARREYTGARIASDVFLPFYRTPYNVAAQGAGMTPAGYAAALSAAMKGQTGEAVDRAVRATVGTTGLYVGLQMAQSGLLTGAYPSTPSERSTLPEGWKPYSLRIPQGDGAVYVPIQSLGAMAVPLGAAAVVADAQRRGASKDDPLKTIYAALGGIGQFMGDMSALQGLNAISKLVTEPERSVESFSEGLASSFVPASGLVRTVQQALGDAARDPDNPVQAFMAGIPGLSESVPTKQTPLGQDRSRGPSGPVALVTGSRVGVEQPNTVTAALRQAGVGIPEPAKTVSTKTVKNIPLTEAEQRDYRRIAGDEISKRVQAYLDNPAWADAGPELQKKKLEESIQKARDAAEQEMLGRIGGTEAHRRVAKPAA